MSSTCLSYRRNRMILEDYLRMQGIYMPKVARPPTTQEVQKMLKLSCRLKIPKTESSHCVNAIISLSQLAAATEDPTFSPEVQYSTSEEISSFLRRMGAVTLPNSLFKKKLIALPPPPPTFYEILEAKVLEEHRVFEEPPKPPRPPPESRNKPKPEPEVIVKPKKGKKGKKGKAKKPLVPFDIHNWRQEMLPVASTALFPRDPPSSPGLLPKLSPPVPVTEPKSCFTFFLEAIKPRVRQY